MDYIVDQNLYAVESLTSHTEYLQKVNSTSAAQVNVEPLDYEREDRDEDSHMREITEECAYTRYTNQEKARFFNLKIDKCLSASAAAKQLGIHIRAAQRWLKQY